jgi:Family of unknown function (DUF6297)
MTVEIAGLRALRQARRKRRVADLEWFDVLYQVYIVAGAGGGLVWWLSTLAKDAKLSSAGSADFLAKAPGWIGLIGAVALFVGVRSGANGGPLAIEEADVRHVLTAPIPLRTSLLRPAEQRVRALVFAGLIGGAIAGELVGQRLGGRTLAWLLSGASCGATIALAAISLALISHSLGRRLANLASVVVAVLVGLQALAAFGALSTGPFDAVGSLALWGRNVRLVDLAAPAIAIGLAIVAYLALENLSVDQMARRSALVSQLRFAATMQDLRTVVLLRRQLSMETLRSSPYLGVRLRRMPIVARGFRSIARFPPRRLLRMALLAAVAGGAQVAAFRGTTPALLVATFAGFLLGLDVIEPFSQELDHPNLTDGLPHEPGWIYQRLLIAPAVVMLLFSLFGVATAWAIQRTAGSLSVGLIIGPAGALATMMGAVSNAVGGAPDPSTAGNDAFFLPPEVAGVKFAVKALWPIMLAFLGVLPVLLVRTGLRHGQGATALAIRSAIGTLAFAAVYAWWIGKRIAFKRSFRTMMEEGKSQARSGRPIGAIRDL